MPLGRLLLSIALGLYGMALVRSRATFSLLDHVNLPIHETGHLVFAPFPEQVTALGGTLFQLIVPFTFATYFLRRRDWHAASVMTWWAGENCVYIGHYMADAVVQELPLVGGGEHDWAFLLGEWNVLAYCEQYGRDVRLAGGAIMLAAAAWGTVAAWRLMTQVVRPSTAAVRTG